jgi:phosphoglycerate dehydrogenase-like enzyme
MTHILVGAASRGRPEQYRKEIDAVLPAALRQATFSFDLHDDDDEWDAAIESCDALILTSRGLGTRAIARASRLRLVQKLGIAMDRVDVAACAARGIALSVLPDAGHVAVAEHTIMMMLAMARKLVPTRAALMRRENPQGLRPMHTTQDRRYPNWLKWPEHDFPLLCDLTLGLIGFGEIAQEVAIRARALGMNVIYTKRRRLDPAVEARFGVAYREMETLLASSHIVSLHATLPDGAAPIIGAHEIGRMRRDAMLINTARGNQLDESALRDALDRGAIGGAALDVFQVEPALDVGLIETPGLLATPHTGGVMPTGRRFRDALANIDAALHGSPVSGLVSPGTVAVGLP